MFTFLFCRPIRLLSLQSPYVYKSTKFRYLSNARALKMTYWREAATLILAAKQVSSESRVIQQGKPDYSQTSEDYKILMLKRSGSSSFMPSRMVFPGGTLSDVDHSREWGDLFHKFTGQSSENLTHYFHQVSGPRPPMISAKRPLWQGITADVAFRICAIRETFEESGILLVLSREELLTHPGINRKHISTLKRWNELEKLELERWRRLVIKNASAFTQMCADLQVFPNIWALYEWNNWLTPVFTKVEGPVKKPMRFDTMFYICCFECDDLPLTSVDETETVLFQWKRPLEYLASDDMLDAPQGYELMRMPHFQSLAQLDQFCKDRAPKGLVCCMPVIQYCNDGAVTYFPGDCSYPENPDYEGTKEGPQLVSSKVAELQDESKLMHRVVYQSGGASDFICNIPLHCGHVSPLKFNRGIVKAADVPSSKI